jgi:hypothetical protein
LAVERRNGLVYSQYGRIFPSFQEVFDKVTKLDIQIDNSESFWRKLIIAVAEKGGLTNKDRIEVPVHGGIISYTLNSAVDVTQIPAVVGIRLITRMVGWQVYCFYLDSSCTSTDVEIYPGGLVFPRFGLVLLMNWEKGEKAMENY